MKPLKVNGRALSYIDGEPFFYLADTAWELFHVLSREEAVKYLDTRASQGFNAVQAVALAELDGLRKPNYYGYLPFHGVDPTMPDDRYWQHVDFVIREAEKRNIYVVLLPTWGDKFNDRFGVGPKVFNKENAFTYGKWIAERYRDFVNIIWMLGGDRELNASHREIIDSMASGIRCVDTSHLITFHPPGAHDSTDYLSDAEYIDFHTSQTGHDTQKCYISYDVMEKMSNASDKPFMDSEPRYEDHPACFDEKIGYRWTAYDVRVNAYWDTLSGACGHTYGHNCVWCLIKETDGYHDMTWEESLRRDGAEQLKYVKKLRLSRDYYSLKPCSELICGNYDGAGHIVSAKGDGYAYIYSPLGLPFTVNTEVMNAKRGLRALWYDVKNGGEKLFTVLPFKGKTAVVPPVQGLDALLILENV